MASSLEKAAQIQAHRSMFGCGNGGRDFDEFNLSEAYHAETEEERGERRFGHIEPQSEELIYGERKPLTKEQKQNKRMRHKNNKRQEEINWRKKMQSAW